MLTVPIWIAIAYTLIVWCGAFMFGAASFLHMLIRMGRVEWYEMKHQQDDDPDIVWKV